MRVTLQQVADYAGVSRRTVDRVINNHESVKPEVRERVKEALRVLNYQPNKIASALAYSRNEIKIGMVYTRDGYKNFDHSLGLALQEAGTELKDFGVTPLVSLCDENTAEEFIRRIDALLEEGIKGLAIRCPDVKELREKVDELESMGIPVVTFNTDLTGTRRRCFFGQDMFQAGMTAGNLMTKMLRPGEKAVVCTGRSDYLAHERRVAGFMMAWQGNGFDEEDLILIRGDQNYETTIEKLEELYQDGWDYQGIYMSVEPNDACGDFLKQHNLGDKTRVVCHDLSEYSRVFLKSDIFDFVIDQNLYKQGYKSLITLKDILRFSDITEMQNQGNDLVIFNSTLL